MAWYITHIQNGVEPHVYGGAELPSLSILSFVIPKSTLADGHLGLYRHREWGYVRIPAHWPNNNLDPRDYSFLPGSGNGSIGYRPFLNLLDNQWEWLWDQPDEKWFPPESLKEKPRGMLIGTEGFGVATSPEKLLSADPKFHNVTRVEALGFRIKLSMKDGNPPYEGYNDEFYDRQLANRRASN
jgi:hypothetical protein